MTSKPSDRERLRERAIREFLSEEEENAWFGMLDAHERVVRAIDERLLDEHGAPLSTMEALVRISHAPAGDISIAELAGEIRLSPSRTSRLVIDLERKGLVERQRDPSDARSTRAAVTGRGIERLQTISPTYLKTVRRLFFSALSEREVRQLGSIWARVAALADEAERER